MLLFCMLGTRLADDYVHFACLSKAYLSAGDCSTYCYQYKWLADVCVGSEKLKSLHAKFTTLMQTRNIPLTSFAEVETTNLPLRFHATIVPQESSGD